MNPNTDPRQPAAAAQLEDLLPALKQAVLELRAGHAPGRAYALLYLLRRELGRVVRPLGTGTPELRDLTWADDVIDATRWTSAPLKT